MITGTTCILSKFTETFQRVYVLWTGHKTILLHPICDKQGEIIHQLEMWQISFFHQTNLTDLKHTLVKFHKYIPTDLGLTASSVHGWMDRQCQFIIYDHLFNMGEQKCKSYKLTTNILSQKLNICNWGFRFLESLFMT